MAMTSFFTDRAFVAIRVASPDRSAVAWLNFFAVAGSLAASTTFFSFLPAVATMPFSTLRRDSHVGSQSHRGCHSADEAASLMFRARLASWITLSFAAFLEALAAFTAPAAAVAHRGSQPQTGPGPWSDRRQPRA